MTKLVFAAGIVAVAAGCAPGEKADAYVPKPAPEVPATTVSEGNQLDLMPLKVGNQWTYSVEVVPLVNGTQGQPRKGEMTWKVVKVLPVEGGSKGIIEVSQQGKVTERQTWIVNKKGIFQAGVKDVPFSTPQPLVTFPMKEGGTFKWSGTGATGLGPKGSIQTTGKVLQIQEVDAESERISAVPIESTTTYKINDKLVSGKSTAWLAPGVGIVRYRQDVVQGNNGLATVIRLKGKSLMRS